jgi:hypothetical protein
MKILSIILLVFLNIALITAQQTIPLSPKQKLGITFSSFGENDVFRFNELDGGASYNADYFYTLGVNYLYAFNDRLEIETGFEYSSQHIIIKPNVYPGMVPLRKAKFSLINIPLALRVNFLKFGFVNPGILIDIDPSDDSPIDNQSGLGALFGLGAKYDFDFGLTVFINPYVKIHSLLPFGAGENHQRVWENGLRIGLLINI